VDDELTDLARWLRERAAAVGCDPDERGGTAELARRSGLDVSQVSRALRGKSIPNPLNAVQFARALGVSTDEMMKRILAQSQGAAQPEGDARLIVTPEQWVARLGLKDPADRSLLLSLVERMKQAQQEREARQAMAEDTYRRVSELVTQLSWDDAHHAGDIPEVLSGLQRLAEALQDVAYPDAE
jgi:transcriptional regulator with XRE-family HTH domain